MVFSLSFVYITLELRVMLITADVIMRGKYRLSILNNKVIKCGCVDRSRFKLEALFRP